MSQLNTALRQELLEMQAADQQLRKELLEKYPGGEPLSPDDETWAWAVGNAHLARMKAIVDEHGWPRKSLVGEEGAQAAWLLVQHADSDVEFQKRCLELLETAARTGEILLTDWCYLFDRVRIQEGRPQLYGTQLFIIDGEYTAGPIEDESRVDERRAQIGQPPLAEYIAMVKQAYGQS